MASNATQLTKASLNDPGRRVVKLHNPADPQGVVFQVYFYAAQQSSLIKEMAEMFDDPSEPMDCPLVHKAATGPCLGQISEWLYQHAEADCTEIPDGALMTEWQKGFFDRMDSETLSCVYQMANFLDVPLLTTLCAKRIASLIKGKSPEEIRQIFGIKDSGFSEGEEEKIKEETSWALY